MVGAHVSVVDDGGGGIAAVSPTSQLHGREHAAARACHPSHKAAEPAPVCVHSGQSFLEHKCRIDQILVQYTRARRIVTNAIVQMTTPHSLASDDN